MNLFTDSPLIKLWDILLLSILSGGKDKKQAESN